ncbi:unnamed protein product [Clonostachys byssicola]|uniref:DUF4470 domain-containing protein n=1 Tax=Clonostachys byssicola TaxID=160290 RepID=A0A9N9U7I9_9HYPO|nr:unnamed protein product [Clonostachys byssicola]
MESETPPLNTAADEARQRGNNLYKQGKLREAETAYLEASRIASDDARPLSNLAAVYYELATSLLLLGKDGGEASADKTRIRLCKALFFSQKTDEANDVLSQITSVEARKTLESLPARASISPQSPSSLLSTRKKLLDRVPRYRTVLQDEPEFYSVGHDDARSFLTKSQLNNGKDLACLCCGIGDARLLFATMAIAAVVSGLKPPKRKLHFTLVDLKATVFARDLLIFRMLFDLQTQTPKQREETNIAISYVFAGQLMPSWASDILHGAMAAVIAELQDLSSNVMGIFYIPEPARQGIARVLKEWQQPPEPWYTTAALRRDLSRERANREMEQSALFGDDMELESGKVPPGCGKHNPDAQSFDDIYIMLPPAHLVQKHEPRLAEIHNAYRKKKNKKNRKVLDDYINSNWKPNVTVIDLEFQRKREDRATGQPDISWSPHQIASDYVGGSLTTFLHGIPLLLEEGKSQLRSYVLRNTPAWLTHDQFLAEYLLLSDRATIESHFHTSLTRSSKLTEKMYHGVRAGPGGIVMVSGFDSAGGILCLPYPRVRFDPVGVLAPLNLTAFLHLIAHVASLGYPLHWLSATLAALCSGMLSRIRAGPPGAEITDRKLEKLAGETYTPADVSVAPFAAEFRTLVAMWEPVLGIPLVWDTPAGNEPLLPKSSMIRRYTIRFAGTIWDSYLMNSFFSVVIKHKNFKAPSNYLAHLLDDRSGEPSTAARDARRAPRLHLISACKWTSDTKTMEFWMDERTIDGVLAEKGWEAWIWRTDTWESAMGPLSLDEGALVKNEAWS